MHELRHRGAPGDRHPATGERFRHVRATSHLLQERNAAFEVAFRPVPDRDRRISARARSNLDFLRGAAALAVFLGHARQIFFASLQPHGLALRLVYRLTSLGHQAVLAFFVLSGFLITDATIAEPGWRRYAAARASRVLTVYWPALALGVALDLLGMRVFGTTGIYAVDNTVWPEFSHYLTPAIAAQNVLFLQGIRAQILGSNLPIWTLAYEAWFYVAFPFVWSMLEGSAARRAASVLALLVIGAIVGPTVSVAFPIWLFGAALAAVKQRVFRRALELSLVATFVAVYGLVAVHPDARPYATRDLVSGALMLVVVAIAAAMRGTPTRVFARASGALAAISYSLYLVHVPLFVFLAAALGVPPQWAPSPAAFVRVAAVIAVTLVYAIAIWFFIERRTPRVRAAFMRALRA